MKNRGGTESGSEPVLAAVALCEYVRARLHKVSCALANGLCGKRDRVVRWP